MKRPASFSPRKLGAPSRFAGGILCSLIAAFVAITACSNQGEGDRCETANGNADCDTSAGLICYPQAQLTNTSSDRCCPEDRSRATHPICKTSVGIADGSTPADTGPPPPPPPDAGGDADAATATDADTDAADAADADAG